MIFNYFSKIPFIIFIAHNFLNTFSSAIPLVEDNMLIAFMKGQNKNQISEFQRRNTRYLDILYEFLYREYFGIPTVKPKFMFKRREFEIEGPIIYAVNCLVTISQVYFIKVKRQYYKYKLKYLFNWHNNFEPKLLNEEKLNYEVKLENENEKPINELILQLSIDTANGWQTNESLEEIIRQKFTKIFEEKLGEMFKRAEERAKKDNPWRANEINDDKHYIIKDSKFDDSLEWVDIYLFSEFFKGQKTNVSKVKQLNVEFHLCNLYSLKKNFRQCDANCKFKTRCKKGRKNSRILNEYLFRLYAEAKSPSESRQLPPVKPIFFYVSGNHHDIPLSLIDVVIYLAYATVQNSCNTVDYASYTAVLKGMDLVNEVELNYCQKKEGENLLSKWMMKIAGHKNQKEGKQILNESTGIKTIREEFEEKMKNMCEVKVKTHEKHFHN